MSEPTKKKRPSYNYTNEDFTKVWNECTTVEEVSAKTGMPKPSCQSKASILRKKGFTLKMLQRGRRKTSVEPNAAFDELNKQLANLPAGGVVDIVWSENKEGEPDLPTPATADELNNGGADAA